MATPKLFNDPRKQMGKKPFFMSKKKWNKIQEDVIDGDEITKKKPFLMSDKRWQELRNTAVGAQQEAQGDAMGMSLFNDLFGELSQFEGLEGFGDLNADYDLGMDSVFGAMAPLLEEINAEQNKPQDLQLQNFTVDPTIIPNYKTGGEVTLELAQTEEGEIYVQPDMTISSTKSTSTHKKMDRDEITDIFGMGGYIFSDNVKIKKKDADIVFGYSQPLYEEKENDTKVQEFNFNTFFKNGEKELGTAELARRIKKKFKVVDNEDTYGNVLVEIANEENRASRSQYLQTLVQLSEGMKPETPGIQVAKYKYGGKVGKAKAPKGQDPKKYWISAAIAGAGLLWNIGQSIGQNKRYKKNLAELESLSDSQKSNMGLSTLAGMGSVFAQDPTETAPDMTATIGTYKQQYDRLPHYLREYSNDRILDSQGEASRTLNMTAPNFSTLSANMANVQSNTARVIADNNANINQQDIQLRNNFLRGLSSLYGQDAAFQAQKTNQERSNRNQQISATGNLVSNYFNQVNAIDAATFSTKMALQGQNAASQNAITNSMFQNALLAGVGLQDALSGSQGFNLSAEAKDWHTGQFNQSFQNLMNNRHKNVTFPAIARSPLNQDQTGIFTDNVFDILYSGKTRADNIG